MIFILIAFDGIHACGKTTLIELVKNWLEKNEEKVYVTSWNSHIIISNMIKQLKRNNRMHNAYVYSLAHLCDFVFRYDHDILPNLSKGNFVLCDRYSLTGVVRDTLRGIPKEYVRNNYYFAKIPILTFIMDIPVEISLERRMITKNRLWRFGIGYEDPHEPLNLEDYTKYLIEMRSKYLEFCEEVPGCIVLDAIKSQDELLDIVTERILLHTQNNQVY